ncbi:WbuC family cupin fold metalloprotein [Fangia hongkongensis]|uniref:WbuC family cupin fold metalloprotein n=1 Tax=Fangia hongkongensis TaxID=270495 RepID=UPI00037FFF34|nr:WbuC family cupin fold metalloprotein [Fangia hongkongensis]MBK2126274.1 WbuC family cupin fold metalloprotein [Fangia hongkongensis]
MKKLDQAKICALTKAAHESPRKRSHHNFHDELSDPVNRLCITLTKGTYIRPHRHSELHKWEMIISLFGKITVLIYDDSGRVVDKFILASDDIKLFEIKPNTWHSMYVVSEEGAFFEVKPGPFKPACESDFAPWAPKENEPEVKHFLLWAEKAKVGDYYQAS